MNKKNKIVELALPAGIVGLGINTINPIPPLSILVTLPAFIICLLAILREKSSKTIIALVLSIMGLLISAVFTIAAIMHAFPNLSI